MKQLPYYTLLLWLLLTVPVYANITIDGESVHVETDGYAVRFDKGVITYIHNKLTNQTYTHPTAHGKNGWSGLLFNRNFWTGKNVSTDGAQLVSAERINPHKAELLYRHEGTDILLCVAIDPMTDDLLIDMEGVSDTPGVVAIQWGIGCLDNRNLSFIVPNDGGRIIDATTPSSFEHYTYPSSAWEAQLAIIQGERGGFYVRNTDSTLQFKWCQYGRLDNGVALNFGTYNQAPFDSYTTVNSQMWRFNTYAGDWRVPARKYRDWMEKAFQPRRLSNIPWTEDITLVVNGVVPDGTPHAFTLMERLAKLADPAKTLLMVAGWATGREWWKEGLVHYPDYEPLPELRNVIETAHRYGFKVMLYADLISFSVDYPLYPEFIKYQYRDTWTGELLGWKWDDLTHPHRNASLNPASSAFREILVQELKAVWQEYDVDAFYMDASHGVINDANGLIDGLNAAQGHALLHKELAEAMPGIVLGGERLHEATFAYESFAHRPLLLGNRAEPHPISTFLFSPFTHAISWGKVPHHDIEYHLLQLEYQKIWGFIPTLRIWGPGHLSVERSVEIDQVLDLARTFLPQYGLNPDVNGDGVVNILDLTLVGQNVGVPFVLPQADVDGDGQVNVLDMILVSNMFRR